jgi:phage regulator Rha-like protein
MKDLTLVNSDLTTTSEIIASHTGISHKKTLWLIRKHLVDL